MTRGAAETITAGNQTNGTSVTNVLSWSAPKKAKVGVERIATTTMLMRSANPRTFHAAIIPARRASAAVAPARRQTAATPQTRIAKSASGITTKAASGGSTKSDADTARQCKRFGGSLRYILARTRRSAI
jgi:hypothetical protein